MLFLLFLYSVFYYFRYADVAAVYARQHFLAFSCQPETLSAAVLLVAVPSDETTLFHCHYHLRRV